MAILVTDDDVVAASAWSACRWNGPLPTIDTARDGSLLEAAARGVRGLRLRGLVEGDDLRFAEDAEELLRAVRGSMRVVAFPAATAAPGVLTGVALTLVSDERGWLIDLTLTDGVHDIGAVPPDARPRSVLSAALAAADTLPPERAVTVLLPSTGDNEGTLMLLSAASTRMSVLRGGRLPDLADLETVSREAVWKQIDAALLE